MDLWTASTVLTPLCLAWGAFSAFAKYLDARPTRHQCLSPQAQPRYAPTYRDVAATAPGSCRKCDSAGGWLLTAGAMALLALGTFAVFVYLALNN